jgi:hypothetical protein
MLLALLACPLASGAQGHGATRIPSPAYGSACGHSSEGGAVLRCEKSRAPEAEPRAPSKSRQQAADSGAAFFAWIYYIRTPPLALLSRSLSFVATHPPPPPAPSRFPSKRRAALPSLLAPFFESLPLQTNKQQTTTRVPPSKAPGPFRCIVLIREIESTKIEVALSERSTGSDAEHGLFVTETYRAPRCRSRRDDRLDPETKEISGRAERGPPAAPSMYLVVCLRVHGWA